MADLIKRCPTCGAHNAATAARCACGAFLIGVDLIEPASLEPAADVPAEPAPSTPDPSQPPAAAPVCSFADCAQTNPAGTTVCVYCNRPMVPALSSEPAAVKAVAAGSGGAAPAPSATSTPPRRTLIQLPAGLAARFEIDEPLKAAGGEADLFIARDRTSGERVVLKLYRHGIEPCTEVLERVSRAAPDQLVRLIEHGRDEGVPYELLEYCQHGSLRMLLKGRPLPLEHASTLLTELVDAIAHLHACGIVHRDLKPENVLIRGLLPLDLVLTDFGSSSITDATMHYTSGARTLRYAAPEVGSNWVGRPTDYWALGMMLVEALTGKHPFEGLSEPVIAHWLVTRPIDVSAISDARWRELCRGLLTRDPKRRWGAAEIERWLAGDTSLTVADEPSAPGVATNVAPYRVGERECRTPRELATALAAHWPVGIKDLKRGMLRAWLQNDLRDQNLARVAADAEEALEISDDERLLRLLLRLDPDLPPVFKGYDVSVPGLAALTRQAIEDHNEARQVVAEIMDRRLLSLFPGSPLQGAQEQYEQARAEFEQALARAMKAGAPRTSMPEGREWQLRMLLFVLDPPADLAETLRASARRVGARAAQRCGWYRALGDIDSASPATLAAMILLGPSAAQAGMDLELDAARRRIRALSATSDSCPALHEPCAAARDRLAATVASSRDEDEVLGLAAAMSSLEASIGASLGALMQQEIFEARRVTDAARVQHVRERIGDWAAWRGGDAWQDFGGRIEIVEVLERRSYRIELATQIESRRVPYKYNATDIARMPAQARATLADVWSCEMPALPQFGTDVKLSAAQQVRCPRCDATGRVELQESWGSLAYPFSTTFACEDKVGVQCQTRVGRASDSLAVAGVPAFVADFITTHAQQKTDPERSVVVEAPRISPRWIESMQAGTVKRECEAMLAASAQDLRAGERIGEQRLSVGWTGLAEVRYRYQGKSYCIWVPDREDVTPIALEHPVVAAEGLAPTDAEALEAPPAEAEAAQERVLDPLPAELPQPETIPPRKRTVAALGWLKSFVVWLAIFGAVSALAAWIVNWKP